jgi:hypothetical protein
VVFHGLINCTENYVLFVRFMDDGLDQLLAHCIFLPVLYCLP